MSKKRWFVSALVLLFAVVLVGQASAATKATGGQNAIIPGDPAAVPSNVTIRESFGTILSAGTEISLWTVPVPPSGDVAYWDYGNNVWLSGTSSFNALFPNGYEQDANGNGTPDIYDLAKAIDANVPAVSNFSDDSGFFFGHPVAAAGYRSIFDVLAVSTAGRELALVVARASSQGTAGQIIVPMDNARAFYLDATEVGAVNGPTPLNVNVSGDTGVTSETIQIATFFNVNDVFGGTGQGTNVVGEVSASSADAFGVRLDVSPAQAVTGQLYLSVEAPNVFPGFIFFRPVTLPTAGQYVYLAAANGAFLDGADALYYKSGNLSPTDPDQFFIIGLDGLEGLVLNISSWYKADADDLTAENLNLIQSVTVTVTE